MAKLSDLAQQNYVLDEAAAFDYEELTQSPDALAADSGLHLLYWVGQWVGVFATWQGVTLPFASAAFVIGSYFLANYQTKHQRETNVKSSEVVSKTV